MATAVATSVSVTEAIRRAKSALETVALTVVGEVSECTVKPGYKAIYFTLGDESSVLPCLMWRDSYDMCGFALRPGMLVEVSGMFTAYAAKGRMQFQVRRLTPAGEGVLRMQVAALARKLEAEGLMSAGRKRPLPVFPMKVGLVTSPRGKAVHDVIRTLRRRYPVAELVIAGVQVEGDGAVAAIVEGLRLMGDRGDIDVVILARGGGSYEDLMPFNSEDIARAVARCPVPVVTGIGHEPDDSIADMVADFRASTPTAAAEATTPTLIEIASRLDGLARLLGKALSHSVTERAHRLRLIAHRPVFRDAECLMSARMQALDVVADALGRALPVGLERAGGLISRNADALARVAPRLLERQTSAVSSVSRRMLQQAPTFLERAERQWVLQAARLEDLSPLAILGRGFAVCYDETGERVLRSSADVAPGDRVRVRLAEGVLGCMVEDSELEV
jgi:exodeoxyribonuclease VII large subunit